jgi:transcriptional regulator with XRE-family HTH domain
MSTLKERIALCMSRRPDLSQADIARLCDVSRPSVSDWLNGKTKSLKPDAARLAAELFGCDQNWIGQGIGAPGWTDLPSHPRREAQVLILDERTVSQAKLTWDSVLSTPTLPKLFSVSMPDGSLEPNLPRGTVIDFESTSDRPLPGTCVLVEDESGARYVRRLVDAGGGEWIAQARHDAYVSLHSREHGLRLLAAMVSYRVLSSQG